MQGLKGGIEEGREGGRGGRGGDKVGIVIVTSISQVRWHDTPRSNGGSSEWRHAETMRPFRSVSMRWATSPCAAILTSVAIAPQLNREHI
jgi:hypothetical protein